MLQLLTFTTLVQRFAASVQGAAKQVLDFTVGSVLRALAEANASIALWLQWLIFLVLSKTRAATSTGPDLDSWMADFSLTRLLAQASTGPVTFQRFTATTSALVQPGAMVKSNDGSQTFVVIGDTAQVLWNASLGGYLIPAGQTSGDATVQAAVAGAAGNVQAGVVTLLASAISGIDTVSNPQALTGGMDAEPDAALRSRFAAFINSRSRATVSAVEYAIQSVQQGLTWTIQENTLPDGSTRLGSFVATVDDGSGSPPSSLLDAIALAIEAMRPVGTTAYVQGSSTVTANVTLTIIVDSPGIKTLLQLKVQATIVAFINALPNGAGLAYARLPGVAFALDPTISNVTSYTLNGGAADIAAVPGRSVKAGTVTVN